MGISAHAIKGRQGEPRGRYRRWRTGAAHETNRSFSIDPYGGPTLGSSVLRKGFGIGASALLAASLLLTVFAGTSLAAASITSAGNSNVSQDTCLIGTAATGNPSINTTVAGDIGV